MEFINLNPDTVLNEAIKAAESDIKLVALGSQRERYWLEERLESTDKSVEEIITASESINATDWLDSNKKEKESDWEMDEMDPSEVVGEWLGESDDKQGFALTTVKLTRETFNNFVGVKLHVEESWKIPAYFNYSAGDFCPSPEVHCAIWKYWEEQFGAKIIGVTSDSIEGYVANPPKSKEEAINLAWQQYLYCSDIVDQGTETISNLASSIINHEYWYFWWD